MPIQNVAAPFPHAVCPQLLLVPTQQADVAGLHLSNAALQRVRVPCLVVGPIEDTEVGRLQRCSVKRGRGGACERR